MKDMVRISDARINGTAFVTVVRHVAPETAAGGPLAHAEYGDIIGHDVAAQPVLDRSRPGLVAHTGNQADEGADLGFRVLPKED